MSIMDTAVVEENLLLLGEPKLHGQMCKTLSAIYAKVLAIFADLETARPRSTAGIQALCALHIALEKTKNTLQHCAECSKIYLAITGDSVRLKFDKARCVLESSLKRVEDSAPESIVCQISEILSELQATEFSLDLVEKQAGDEIVVLLQRGRTIKNGCSDNSELDFFHQAVSKLGITSSRAALVERRALKKLLERARAEEDKRKESIVGHLLHLMRKYSKLFRSELSDDNDSQGSTPCSPTVHGSFEGRNICPFEQQLSKLSSFNSKASFLRSDQVSVPPELLRCPISLQLMYDPVIIASGQTFERSCIEKWFSDGHHTCPKTQLPLSHLCLTPNYSVKGLVASWCEQNGVPIPVGPPESVGLNYWRLSFSESEAATSMECIGTCKFKGVKVVPLEDSDIIEEGEVNEKEDASAEEGDRDVCGLHRCEDLLAVLDTHEDLQKKCKVVEQIRCLLKDDEEARIYMGANGFVEALIRFMESAVLENNETAQDVGAMAIFNLAVNNNRNKQLLLDAGVLTVLSKMIADSTSIGAAIALYMNLACLEQAKPIIGSTEAVPLLIQVLQHESDPQCKLDALHTLYNLSNCPTSIPHLLSAGILESLLGLITNSSIHSWAEKSIAIVINLCSSRLAKDEIREAPGLITALATILDTGEPVEQEQAAACLLILCNGNVKCSQMVLQEGVIPSLVSISVNGTMRGKHKAQKLLMLFREQRQRDLFPVEAAESNDTAMHSQDSISLSKSSSRRRLGRAWSYWWKSKSFSLYQC